MGLAIFPPAFIILAVFVDAAFVTVPCVAVFEDTLLHRDVWDDHAVHTVLQMLVACQSPHMPGLTADLARLYEDFVIDGDVLSPVGC